MAVWILLFAEPSMPLRCLFEVVTAVATFQVGVGKAQWLSQGQGFVASSEGTPRG